MLFVNKNKLTRCLALLVLAFVSIQLFAPPLVEANHAPRRTRLFLLGSVVKHGSNGTLIAILSDEHGQPIAGRAVEFYIYILAGWNYIGVNTTDKNGVATLTLYVTLMNGTYLIRAVFKGDSWYMGSEDVSEMVVEEDPPILPF